MIEANQIRGVIADYLRDNDSNKFVVEFAKLSHNIHKNGSPEAIELANEIEFASFDYYIGDVDKLGFQLRLRALQGSFNG